MWSCSERAVVADAVLHFAVLKRTEGMRELRVRHGQAQRHPVRTDQRTTQLTAQVNTWHAERRAGNDTAVTPGLRFQRATKCVHGALLESNMLKGAQPPPIAFCQLEDEAPHC